MVQHMEPQAAKKQLREHFRKEATLVDRHRLSGTSWQRKNGLTSKPYFFPSWKLCIEQNLYDLSKHPAHPLLLGVPTELKGLKGEEHCPKKDWL